MAPRVRIDFSSDGLAPEQRLRRWQELIGDHLGDIEMRRLSEAPLARSYEGGFSLRGYDGATFTQAQSADQYFERTPERIRRGNRDVAVLHLLISGECYAETEGRRAKLTAGDICLYESGRPHKLETPGRFESLAVMIDRAKAEAALGDLRALLGRRLPASAPVTQLAARFWRDLARNGEHLSPERFAPLLGAGLDILKVALEDAGYSAARSTTALQRARVYIQTNLHRQGLSPEEIAQAAGLSLRRLQELFQAEGETIQSCLQQTRLEAAAKRLAEPMFSGLSVGAVMERVGFSDPSHFSRAFKQAYGCSPRDWRRGAGKG